MKAYNILLRAISIIFKILGWFCILCIVVGGPKILLRSGFDLLVFPVIGFYGLLAWLFLGLGRKLKAKSCKRTSTEISEEQ